MGRISERFADLKARGECALVVFLTAGDPSLEATEALILGMAEAGADIIEIGVPFSDPIAEGETIQRASERALARGASLRRIIQLVSRLRDEVEQPLLLMGYANPIHAMGAGPFAEAAAAAGVDGIIIPDLPLEAGEPYYAACRERDIDVVLMAAPTTTPARMEKLARASRGFLYYVSLQGVTGARASLAEGIEARVKEAKGHADIPVCVGFGISTPEHAAVVRGFADGVVVGSAIVKAIEAAESPESAVADVADLVARLKAPLR